MPQIFQQSTNTIFRAVLIAVVLLVFGLPFLAAQWQRSDYATSANLEREQPVQFSHRHHVADDGIDCRYCHTTVETSPFAGIPATEICMNCHSQIFRDSPYLAPVRESYQNGLPIPWVRVHQLPDFVYFDHSIHIAKGVGCSTCHGRVDQMPLVRQVASLQMEWCLDCHRSPDRFLRPLDQVFAMDWQPASDHLQRGRQLAQLYGVRSAYELTSCSICHR